jgi:hypothetical protein
LPLKAELIPIYEHLPFLGRSSSGGVSLRYDISSILYTTKNIPFLEYPVFLFSDSRAVTVTLYFTMVLESDPEDLLRYDVSFDDALQKSVRLLEEPSCRGDLPPGWSVAVQDGVWKRSHVFSYDHAGPHFVKFRPTTKGLVLEKLVIDVGGVRESYLGPPQSRFI